MFDSVETRPLEGPALLVGEVDIVAGLRGNPK